MTRFLREPFLNGQEPRSAHGTAGDGLEMLQCRGRGDDDLAGHLLSPPAVYHST